MPTQARRPNIQSLILDPRNRVLMESETMFNLLHSELEFIGKKLEGTPRDFSLRRIYIRSFFALVESCIFRLKQDALALKEFPPEETLLLKELRCQLDDGGKVQLDNLQLRTVPNLRYAFKALVRALGITFDLDTGDNKWNSFKKALNIRHKIVHPKGILDLLITDSDWNTVREGHHWFYGQLVELKKRIDERFPSQSAPNQGKLKRG